MRTRLLAATMLVVLSGCGTSPDEPPPPRQADPAPTRSSTTAPETTGSPQMVATRVRFSTAAGEIVVQLTDNPTSRDLVSKLPLTLKFEEFAGREKISYLPDRLTTEGSPGSVPRNGDLICYAPWGNLGLYYNADPNGGHDDNVILLGTVASGMDRIDRLEGDQITVEVVE